jgi:hypothetical protein
LVIFQIGSWGFCSGSTFDCNLPTYTYPPFSCIAGITDMYHYTQLSCSDGDLNNILPGLASNLGPPCLYFSCSCDYKCGPLHLTLLAEILSSLMLKILK